MLCRELGVEAPCQFTSQLPKPPFLKSQTLMTHGILISFEQVKSPNQVQDKSHPSNLTILDNFVIVA